MNKHIKQKRWFGTDSDGNLISYENQTVMDLRVIDLVATHSYKGVIEAVELNTGAVLVLPSVSEKYSETADSHGLVGVMIVLAEHEL